MNATRYVYCSETATMAAALTKSKFVPARGYAEGRRRMASRSWEHALKLRNSRPLGFSLGRPNKLIQNSLTVPATSFPKRASRHWCHLPAGHLPSCQIDNMASRRSILETASQEDERGYSPSLCDGFFEEHIRVHIMSVTSPTAVLPQSNDDHPSVRHRKSPSSRPDASRLRRYLMRLKRAPSNSSRVRPTRRYAS